MEKRGGGKQKALFEIVAWTNLKQSVAPAIKQYHKRNGLKKSKQKKKILLLKGRTGFGR